MLTISTDHIAVAYQMLVEYAGEEAYLDDRYDSFLLFYPKMTTAAHAYMITQGYISLENEHLVVTDAGWQKACELRERLEGLMSGKLRPNDVYRV